MFFYLMGIAFCIWLIYFGGAERLESTLLGYLEFGAAAEKSLYIKLSAWVGLIICACLVLL